MSGLGSHVARATPGFSGVWSAQGAVGAAEVHEGVGEAGGIDIARWEDRVRLADAEFAGTWELPAIGAVAAPTAVLIRPDGYVAWVGDSTQLGLADALTTWFGPPATG